MGWGAELGVGLGWVCLLWLGQSLQVLAEMLLLLLLLLLADASMQSP